MPGIAHAATEKAQAQRIPAAGGQPARRYAALFLSFPCFVYLLITWVLPPPLPIRAGALLDPSWQIILTDAFLKGSQFGRDLVYTYGPWGFLSVARGNPAIYPWLVFGRLAIAVPFVLAISSLALHRIPQSSLVRHLFIAAVVLLGDPIPLLPVVLACLLIELHEPAPSTRLQIHILAVMSALTMWIKFTGFVLVALLAAAIAIQDLSKRRKPFISIEIAACSLAWWWIAGQPLSALPAYLRGAFSIAKSYSAEMFTDGPGVELGVATVLVVAIGVPFIKYALSSRRSIWPCLGWFGLLFLAQLKEAFVRHDSFHIWSGIVNGLLPAAILLFCTIGVFEACPLPNFVFGPVEKMCVACLLSLSLVVPLVELGSDGGRERLETLDGNLRALTAVLGGEAMSARYATQLANFQRALPLAKVSGTASFFPDDEALLYGNGISVRLPPMPQAFAAYNSYLSGRNAALYRSAQRPDFVFFDVRPIDTRYATSSDSLSWRALLECYKPAGESGKYVVLESHGCHPAPRQKIGEFTAQAQQPIVVPDANRSAIWVEFDLRTTVVGSAMTLLARPPLTQLIVRTAAKESIFRISPEAARTGFLLSPLMRDPGSFEHLYTDTVPEAADQVREMRVVLGGGVAFEPAFGVRFYRVALPGRQL